MDTPDGHCRHNKLLTKKDIENDGRKSREHFIYLRIYFFAENVTDVSACVC